MQSESDLILRLVDDVYEAAGARPFWPAVLSISRRGLHSKGAMVVSIHGRTRNLICSDGFSDHFVSSYRTDFILEDPWLNDVGDVESGTTYRLVDSIAHPPTSTGGALNNTSFYRDWMVPQALDARVGLILPQHRSLSLVLSWFRSADVSVFDSGEHAILHNLGPHIGRAARLRFERDVWERERRDYKRVIDMFSVGIAVADTDGTVRLANTAAESVWARGDVLRLKQGRLTTVRAEDRRKLSDALRDGAGLDGKKVGQVLRFDQNNGRPLAVLVAPSQNVLPTSEGPFERYSTIITISDPALSPRVDCAWLGVVYGLTPKEARLAALIGEGNSLREAAVVMNIGLGTARTHLKRAFGKTGTARQAELVRLIARGPSASMVADL